MITDEAIQQLADQIDNPREMDVALHQIKTKAMDAYVERERQRTLAEPSTGDFTFEVTLPSRPTERMIEMMLFLLTKPNREKFRERFPMKPIAERIGAPDRDWGGLWDQGIVEYQCGMDHFCLTLLGKQLLKHLNGGFATGGVIVGAARLGTLVGEVPSESVRPNVKPFTARAGLRDDPELIIPLDKCGEGIAPKRDIAINDPNDPARNRR